MERNPCSRAFKRVLAFIITATVCSGAAFCADKPKTRITGGSMEIIKGGQQVIFLDSAKVIRGENVLMAEKIVQDKKNNVVEAYTNVVFSGLSASGEVINGESDKARYDMDAEFAELWDGKPKVTYFMRESTGPLVLQADRINMDQAKEQISAYGNVIIISSSGTARSPQALFLQKERKIVLTGIPQPLLLYGDKGKSDKSEYKADKITFLLNENKILLEGNVKGKMVSSKGKKTEKR
ncbi:MAG: LptA/OstA family protein [Elusimicrobiota bacterium]